MLRIIPLVSAAVISALVAGCASTSNPESLAQNDPYEPTNRAVFEFDIKLDRYVASPIARGYNYAVPTLARDGVHNVLTNLNSPVVFANDLLQGEFKRAGQTLWRATLNSTFGLGGLLDAAGKAGIPAHEEDFGQTLGVWGSGEGSYLVLPFVGPRPPRDLAGSIVDIGFDPFTYVKFKNVTTFSLVRAGMSVLDYRAANVETLEQIERSSIDFYATTRSLYRQHRNAEISNGTAEAGDLPEIQ
jgi:phospholipid-binding lipoprotein MlaA